MKNFLYRLFWRLRTDNNIRALCAWIVVITWLTLNFWVFGLGPSQPSVLTPASLVHKSEELNERRQNLLLHKQFKTDEELGLAPKKETRKKEPDRKEKSGWFFGKWSWILWVLVFIVTVIYTPLAFRDEAGRALDKVFGSRLGGSSRDLPDPNTQQRGGERGHQGNTAFILVWEFIKDILFHKLWRIFR